MARAAVQWAAFVALGAAAAATWYTESASSCFSDRLTAKPPGLSRPAATLLAQVVFAFIYAVPPRSFSRRAVIAWPLCALLFFAAYTWVALAREWQGDLSCGSARSKHANGISGHAMYYLYVVLALLSALRESARAGQRWKALGSWCLLAAQSALTLWIICMSWARGYHSPRQILLGACAGLALERLLWVLVRAARSSRASCAAVTAALAAVMVAGYLSVVTVYTGARRPLFDQDVAAAAVAIAALALHCAVPEGSGGLKARGSRKSRGSPTHAKVN
eukprot:m51a1_g8702 hypothetical protein (277) ;mRNA; f:89558-90692